MKVLVGLKKGSITRGLDFDLEAGGFTIVVILKLNYGL